MSTATATPDSWTVTRLGWVFQPVSDRGYGDAMVLSVYRDHGVIPKDSRTDNFNRAPENLSNYQLVRFGDLVVNRMKAWQGSLGISEYQGIVSPDYEVLRPIGLEYDPRFLHSLLRSRVLIDQYALRSTGIRPSQWRLYWDEMKTIEVSLPSAAEQRVIADYLDRETARIDALIEEQQRLIEMLRERRQDLIRAAVLGTENPFAPTADSASTAIGHHFSVTLGKMLDAGKVVRADDQMLPYIRAGNIQDVGLNLEDVNEMPYSATEAANLNLLAGDLLVVEGGAVGTNVVIRQGMPGWSFQKTVNRLRSIDGWSSAWLGYLLRTYRDIGVIDIVCNKSTIPHLTAEKLRAMRVPSVPPEEQIRVVEMLDQETAKIDALIMESGRFVELSKERRAALIAAAVTGQIDVREVA